VRSIAATGALLVTGEVLFGRP